MPATMLSTLILGASLALTQRGPVPLEPRDVLTRPEIAEVQIAPDGRKVALAIRTRDLRAGRTMRSVWLARIDGEGIDSLPVDPRASNLRWRPNGLDEITYLAPSGDGTTQLWGYTPAGGSEQLTAHRSSVLSFEWSSDGRRLAFTALKAVGTSLDLVAGGVGVVVDGARFRYTRLLENRPLTQRDARDAQPRTRTDLWVYDVVSDKTRRVSLGGSVTGYAWAPNGHWLAITAHRKVGPLPSWYAPHDLLLYRTEEMRLEVLEQGHGSDDLEDGTMLSNPFWAPDSRRIAHFRRDWRDWWASSPQLAIFSLDEGRRTLLIPDDSLELYKPRGIWLHPDTVLVESTYRAGRRLFAVALEDASVNPVVEGNDWFDQHSFSSDGRFVAFTRERIDTPPDLYVSDYTMRRARRLTSLHTDLSHHAPPHVERLHWKGQDGVDVEGWLYLPRGSSPPFPTVVFVHGGPTPVVGNRYEPYLGIWSHGFGVYAARGIAVFVPNYRGTASYGKSFRTFAALDAEPVSDIVTGIDMLVRRGIADADRLGIAGHSHGCWLGALIAVRERRFVAAALAEGTANWASSYGRNPGFANLQVIDHYVGDGASPYEAPGRYRRHSPVHRFAGVQTAFLFEAGELSGALHAVEYAVAASQAGVPHELVIYRNTGHGTSEPGVMLEVMQRNLDWFEFWLLDRQPSDESKRGQYDRWRRLRDRTRRGTG